VRYHLSDIPLSIDPEAFRLEVKGKVDRALSLSLADLKTGFEPVELVAVHQCSGNSRGFVEPRVAGGQLGHGAMGNARWRGVPLKAVLDRAGVQAGSRQVTLNGLDGPALPETPDFVKALDLDHARDGEVMIAYAMNGEDLPGSTASLCGWSSRILRHVLGQAFERDHSDRPCIRRLLDGERLSRARQ